MAAKVQTKIEKVTARAGIFCAESYFRGFQLDKLINEVLGVRSKVHNGFQWDEVILPLFDTCLCGGDYLEDEPQMQDLLPCDKADAKYSYEQAYGYFPGVYSIDGVIAYMENRDGEMDKNGKDMGAQTLYGQTLR